MGDRVWYTEANDFDIDFKLKQIDERIKYLNSLSEIEIDDCLEIFNITSSIDFCIKNKFISNENLSRYREHNHKLKAKMHKRFMDFIHDDLYRHYIESDQNMQWEFFKLMSSKLDKIDDITMHNIIADNKTWFICLLTHKSIVNKFKDYIADVMRNTDKGAPVIICRYIRNNAYYNGDKYYIPDSISIQDKEDMIKKYIKSDETNPNVLIGIINHRDIENECVISNYTRYEAKLKYDKWRDSVSKYGHTFKIPGIKRFTHDLSYKEVLLHLGFDTGLLDNQYQIDCYYKPSRLGAIESVLLCSDTDFYRGGSAFTLSNNIVNCRIQQYQYELNLRNKSLEGLLAYFYNEYITEVFGISGFNIPNITSDSSFTEKCIVICSSIERVLKQYECYKHYGWINNHAISLTSKSHKINAFDSLRNNKYAYPISRNLSLEMSLLFSNQLLLSYHDTKKRDLISFYEYHIRYGVNSREYSEIQKTDLDFLVNRGSLCVNNGKYEFNMPRLEILYRLYSDNAISTRYYREYTEILDNLYKSGDIKYGESLLSIPEQNYYNYMMNRAIYTNGFDLRNKYMHGSFPIDKAEIYWDYTNILKIAIIIMYKIYEELAVEFIDKVGE